MKILENEMVRKVANFSLKRFLENLEDKINDVLNKKTYDSKLKTTRILVISSLLFFLVAFSLPLDNDMEKNNNETFGVYASR